MTEESLKNPYASSESSDRGLVTRRPPFPIYSVVLYGIVLSMVLSTRGRFLEKFQEFEVELPLLSRITLHLSYPGLILLLLLGLGPFVQ